MSDVESLNAINYLASKKQLDYQIKNNQIKFRNLEDSYGLRRYDISYKSRRNYTLNHLIERIKVYNEENFNYDIVNIPLKN